MKQEVDLWQEATAKAVNQAQDNGSQQGSCETSHPSNNNNNETFNNDFVPHAWVNGPHGCGNHATGCGQPGTKGKNGGNDKAGIDTYQLGHVAIQGSGPDNMARTGAGKEPPQNGQEDQPEKKHERTGVGIERDAKWK